MSGGGWRRWVESSTPTLNRCCWPRGAPRRLSYTALINIRPSQGNRSMEIQDTDTRRAVREITHDLIGRGEELPQ